jgi:hypothetical protein
MAGMKASISVLYLKQSTCCFINVIARQGKTAREKEIQRL